MGIDPSEKLSENRNFETTSPIGWQSWSFEEIAQEIVALAKGEGGRGGDYGSSGLFVSSKTCWGQPVAVILYELCTKIMKENTKKENSVGTKNDNIAVCLDRILDRLDKLENGSSCAIESKEILGARLDGLRSCISDLEEFSTNHQDENAMRHENIYKSIEGIVEKIQALDMRLCKIESVPSFPRADTQEERRIRKGMFQNRNTMGLIRRKGEPDPRLASLIHEIEECYAESTTLPASLINHILEYLNQGKFHELGWEESRYGTRHSTGSE